jgi:dihydroorotase
MITPTSLTIKRPDDWHVHLRDGAMLAAVAPHSARTFNRVIVMPNLAPPVTTASAAADYRRRIIAAAGEPDAARPFLPLMTCYLTDSCDPKALAEGFLDGVFTAAKLYPAGATTNSQSGVTDVAKIASVLAKMEEIGMPLLIHGEVTDAKVDVFDREAVFIDRILVPMRARFPHLKIVFEHITTKEAADFVKDAHHHVAATITAHHLVINRNDLFKGGLRPHNYCLPVAKREVHRLALRAAAVSGDHRFFLGTDTAPHAVHLKEADCGCAGVFSAPAAIETYAQVFEEESALDKLEGFASLFGPRFYGLDENEATITLVREPWTVPDAIEVAGGDKVRPFLAGETLNWRVVF